MNDITTTTRVVIICCLLLSLVAAGIFHGSQSPAPELGVPFSQDELVVDYDSYLDQEVLVNGEVISTDPVMIRATSNYGESITLGLRGMQVNVAEGDQLSVYGTVQPDNRITVINVIHKPADIYWRTRVLSLLAGIWVLGRALRYWMFDTSHLLFRIRPSPFHLSSLTSSDNQEDEDA